MQLTRLALPLGMAALAAGRFAFVNVWRSICLGLGLLWTTRESREGPLLRAEGHAEPTVDACIR